MAGNKYNLALEITASTQKAMSSISAMGRNIQGLGRSSGGVTGGLTTGLGTAVKMAGMLGSVVTGIGSAFFAVGQTIWSVFSTAFSIVKDIASTLMGLTFTGLKAGLAGIAAIGAATYGAHKALGPAAEMEKYKVQLGVLKKEEMLPEYVKTASKSPYQVGEVVQGGILMEAFHISSKEFMSTVVDAAAAFNKPIEEIVRILGYAQSGRTGEAMESATRIGITRDDLKALGLKFEKSGAVAKEDSAKLMGAFVQIMKSRFGGMAEKQSGTYGGKISNLGDAIFQAFATGLEKALPYAKTVLDGMISMVTKVGEKFAEVDWKGFGESFTGTIGKGVDMITSVPWEKIGQFILTAAEQASNIVGKLFTEDGRAEIVAAFTQAWDVIKTGWPTIADALLIDLITKFTWVGNWMELKIGAAFDSLTQRIPAITEYIATGIGQVFVSIVRMLYDALTSAAGMITAGIVTAVAAIPGMKTMMSRTELGKEYVEGDLAKKMEISNRIFQDAKFAPFKGKTTAEQMKENALQDAEIRRKQLEQLEQAGFQGVLKSPGVIAETTSSAVKPLMDLGKPKDEKTELLKESQKEFGAMITNALEKMDLNEIKIFIKSMSSNIAKLTEAQTQED